MNIKGLYFKLNIDKPVDKAIYDLFNEVSKRDNVSKINILYGLCSQYYDVMITMLEDKKND